MLKKAFFCIFVMSALSAMSFGQKVYSPKKGSPERTAILNALRVPVERELKQKIQFSIEKFNSNGTWAFLSGAPQNMSGGKPNYKGTPYQEALDDDMFDNNFFALLKKTGMKWKVVTYAIGCTDVCYAFWWKDHKAPKSIFPYTE